MTDKTPPEMLADVAQKFVARSSHKWDGEGAWPYEKQPREIQEAMDALAAYAEWQETRTAVLTWQPIETAPKDGTEILAWRKDCGVLVVRWDCPEDFLSETELQELGKESAEAYSWFCADFVTGARLEGSEVPTHWMPLPAGPDLTGSDAGGEGEK